MTELALQQQNVLGDLDALERIERFANVMASGRSTIPKELQNNLGDCLAIALQAAAWQMNPFAVAQKSHVIKGKLGYEAQLVNAVITRHAPIEGRLTFTYSEGWEKILGRFRITKGQNGDYAVADWSQADEKGLWCEVSATMKGENEPRVTRVQMVQAYPRQSTQWATDPKQQLTYVTIKRWARLHCPDIILGIYTPDELQNREMPEKDVTPADRIKARLSQGRSPAVRTDDDSPSAGTVIDHTDGEETPVRTAKDSPVHRTPAQNTPIEHEQDNTQEGVKDNDRLSRVRNILKDQKVIPLAEPNDQDRATLQMAIDSIVSCKTLDELDQCGKDLTDMIHPDLKPEAIRVFKERRKVLGSTDKQASE